MTTSNPMTEFLHGYASRKFFLALFALVIITGFGVATIWFSVFESLLTTIIGGIIGVLTVYYGGNITGKFIAGKHVVEMGKQTEVTEAREASDVRATNRAACKKVLVAADPDEGEA